MVSTFTRKWIIYALSILVAAVAAFESARLLLLIAMIAYFCVLKKFSVLHVCSVILVGILAFNFFNFQIKQLDVPLNLPATLTWTGDYKISGNQLRGFMKDENNRKIYVVYKFTSEAEKEEYKAIPLVGKQYFVHGELESPSKPAHKYAFNMENYLKSKGAIGILEISAWSYIGSRHSLSQKIGLQRFKIKKHIEETFPKNLAAEAQALLIGLQDNVDDDLNRAYQKLGITHLFAISGLHIAIVSFIFFQGLLRLNVRRELATIVLIVILPLYAILAGGAPSIWRSVSVVELILLSRIKWRLPTDDALAISFIGFVLLAPWSIYQVGFQLSYLATASLIYSSQILRTYNSWWIQSFWITFVCQLLVYPLLLLHFYEISLSSFFVNIVFVPLFSFVILPINIILLAISFIPGPISDIIFMLYEKSRFTLSNLIHILQSIPFQMWNPGKPSELLCIFSYISVFISFYLLDVRAKIWKIVTILLIPVLCIHFSGKIYNELKISFVNVGQGDCIVIELPYRKAVFMIDTGGLLRFDKNETENKKPFEIGRQVVVPYLEGKGITKIDKLIITHADADHAEGAEEILQEIRVEEIHITPNSLNNDDMNDLLMEATHQMIPIREQIANNGWQVEDVSFQYLWPHDSNYEGNNDSLVLYVSRGDFEAIFTGDLEEKGEQEILQKYMWLAKIDLLKAGHHGSKTSSSEQFIEILQPSLTVFSAGENNRYGHPHKEVVERFHALGLKTITTGEVGTIEIKILDKQMDVWYSNE